jgi:TonB family protein
VPAGVATGFIALVGSPSSGSPATGGGAIVPGVVLPLESDEESPGGESRKSAIEKRLSLGRAIDKLWGTFRLDPEKRLQSGRSLVLEKGKSTRIPVPKGAKVEMSATLLSFDGQLASYQVVFRQGKKILVDSRVDVKRGGRAVVGGTDGETAPYIFLVVEPDLPAKEGETLPLALASKGITSPTMAHKVPPKYPEAARAAKVTGTVILEAVVDTNGKVIDLSVVENPDQRLTDAAIEAVRQWTFEPARRDDGTPIRVRFVLTVVFRLG